MAPFNYTVTRLKKFSASLSLTIHPEKGVVVRAPFWVPDIAIRKFIEDRSTWIETHLKQAMSPLAPEKKYLPGEKHLYFGREYVLTIQEYEHPLRTQAVIANESLQVSLYRGHLESKRTNEIREAILRLYLETGIAVITEKVNYFSEKIGVSYSRIDIKKVSSIWGSCSPTNRLCFNRKLIMAPHEVVDYVIIHEVAHMVHRNHSSRFWGLVARFDSNYKQHRQWLHHNHLLLSL